MDAPRGPASEDPDLAIVESRAGTPAGPRIRITRAMPAGMTPEAAVALARARASQTPARRFQVLQRQQPGAASASVLLWDSHAAN